MPPVNIIYYISGHGYGHATRSAEIMNALARRLKNNVFFHIRSNAPLWIFNQCVTAPFEYHFVSIDVGAVHRSFFDVDTLNTLRDSYKFYVKKKTLIAREVDFIEKHKVSLILADIPPISFEIAKQAKIPGIGVGNFSWDWIYEPYTKEYPQFAKVVPKIKESYSQASLFLQLPFSVPMKCFKKSVRIPLVTRKATMPREQVLMHLGVDKNCTAKLALLSFGGLDAAGYLASGVKKTSEYLFVVAGDQPMPKLDNIVMVNSQSSVRFLDLVAACDVVLGKTGYGLVSECVANRTPLLYTDRDNFREYEVMKRTLSRYLPSARMPRYYLVMGEWKESLDYFFKSKLKWPKVAINGADEAARIVTKYLP